MQRRRRKHAVKVTIKVEVPIPRFFEEFHHAQVQRSDPVRISGLARLYKKALETIMMYASLKQRAATA